jgi:hypothetical protein
MSTTLRRPRLPTRVAAGAAGVSVLCLVMAGCQPEPPSPSASVSPTASTSPTASASPTAATPTPTESAQAGEDIELPPGCEKLYSPAMLASLQQKGPLNDPGVTMTSTQNVDALELLTSGIPTIRCTWGAPSETGLATNVSIVDAEQSAAIATALANAGFACESRDGATVCRYTQTMVDLDDDLVELTETHALRANAWVSTATINFASDGYTEDILATLWG